jgi:hypothetical protein
MIDVNVARMKGALTPNILQQALDVVQKRHPMLKGILYSDRWRLF